MSQKILVSADFGSTSSLSISI